MGENKERVGVIGVGRMGLAMVKHLAKHGYAVSAADINADNLGKAKALGALPLATAAAMGRAVDVVILGVGYDDEVIDVVLGPGGLHESLPAGSVIAVSSTVAPQTVKSLEERFKPRGIGILDAPICRGRWYADNGQLLALFGGDESVVARSRPVYATFCSDIVHLGAVGHGQVAKAMNNLLLWVNSIGLIEAGRIAEASGMDMARLRQALMMSSAKSQALEDWDQTTFTWALKDMQIVSAMTDAAGLSLPITGAVKELVKEARRIKATNPPNWSGKPG